MKRYTLKKSLALLMLALMILLSLVLWLIGTEGGLQLTYKYAASYLPGELKAEKLKGKLIGPITVEGLGYQHDGTIINAKKVTLDWTPSTLFGANIEITRLHIQSLTISMPQQEKQAPELLLPDIQVPWHIVVNDLVINDVKLMRPDNVVNLQTVRLNASLLFNKLDIQSFEIKADAYNMELKGELYPFQDYRHQFDIAWNARLPANNSLDGIGRIKGNISATSIQQQLKGPVQLTLNADIYDLLKNIRWHAEADIIEINPGKLWPEWSGKITGKLSSKGQTVNGQLLSDENLIQLSGKLRDYPLSLNSRLSWRDDGIEVQNFNLRSGTADINAHGKLGEKLNVDWDVTAANLSQLHPQAQGQLQGKGRLSGTQAVPEIAATIYGKDLRFFDFKAGVLNSEINIDLFRWRQAKLRLASQSVQYNEYVFRSLHLNADAQSLEINATSDLASAQIKANGKPDDLGWHGYIERIDIKSQHLRNWKLTSPAALNIVKKTISLESFCLYSDDARLCTTLQQDNHNWKAMLRMSNLPISIIHPLLPPDINIDGKADANAEFSYRIPDQLHGQAKIELSPGNLSFPSPTGERAKWEYHDGTATVDLSDQGLDARIDIIAKKGQLKAQLTLPGVTLPYIDNNQALYANSEVKLFDLGIIEALFPEVRDLKGDLIFSFEATGTLAQPKLSGHANLSNSSLNIPRLGLTVTELTLSSRTDSANKLDFMLNARSGDGALTVRGHTSLNRNEGWPTAIDIRGDMFEVSRTPVARVVVSPNLNVVIEKRNIKISGDINIPYAKLQPKDISTAARVSQDAVIIGDEKPVEDKWSIFTKVRLTLGKRVNFFGYGFEGRFGGNLLLEDEPGKPTRATGEINIPEGLYNAYGQRLNVEHGRLLFTGGPLTNPGLDMRAIRKIGDVTAGLKVRGSLSQPVIEIFSIPAMGQTDALSYLILGRPLETASDNDGTLMARAALALGLSGGDSMVRLLGDRFGLDEMRIESSATGEQASLIIGRYLSPKLYVGYGVGLIESYNTFMVRYDITDKWQLKGESGEHQGADLLYTIER